MTFVVEAGATTLEAVRLVLDRVAPGVDSLVEVIDRKREAEADWCSSTLGAAEAVEALSAQSLGAVAVRRQCGSGPALLTVYRPGVAGDRFPLWHGAAELRDVPTLDASEVARDVPGLVFVAVLIDDTLDLDDITTVNATTFPWDDWRLVEAVVRSEDTGLMEWRRGPARPDPR